MLEAALRRFDFYEGSISGPSKQLQYHATEFLRDAQILR
jgi:hypothetical protein